MANNSPQYYQNLRPEVLNIIPRSSRRILEVGCGAGVMGAALKSRQECEVTGMEIILEVEDQARSNLDRVIIGDFVANSFKLEDSYYDTIILADVLEHLPDTDVALQIINRKLSDTGSLVLSIPNIRHWSIIHSLLEGDWRYQDEGLLDRTHLKFFTHRSLIRTLAVNGFFPISTTSSKCGTTGPGFMPFIEHLQHFGINATNLYDEINDYQYLMVCQKLSNPDIFTNIDSCDTMEARSVSYLMDYYKETNQHDKTLPLVLKMMGK